MKIRTGRRKETIGFLLAAAFVCMAETGCGGAVYADDTGKNAAVKEAFSDESGREETGFLFGETGEEKIEIRQEEFSSGDEQERSEEAGAEKTEKPEISGTEAAWTAETEEAETAADVVEESPEGAQSAPDGSWEKAVSELIAEKELEEDEEKSASSAAEDSVGETAAGSSAETAEDFDSGGNSEETAEPELETGGQGAVKLSVEPEDSGPKAGQDFLYNVTLENTGQTPLENVMIQSGFGATGLYGVWDTTGGYEQAGYALIIGRLEKGEKKLFYLTVSLPETYAGLAALSLYATGEYTENEERYSVSAEAENEVMVGALKADFEVTKTADRTAAVPGDRILFQICIRNTGELTLHSVITTEKFQLEDVPVEFLEKDGVVLNDAKTKARIAEIAPGEAVSLNAAVTLPEDIKSQELINEVTVTTAETGESTVTTEARVQIYGAEEESAQAVDTASGKGEGNDTAEARTTEVADSPKTGDETQTVVWIFLALGAAGTGAFLRTRIRTGCGL